MLSRSSSLFTLVIYSNQIIIQMHMNFVCDCFQALLHSVPAGKLVVLDLFAEVKPIWITSEQFYGVPYIWKVIFYHIFIF